jgi:hypothetical protein
MSHGDYLFGLTHAIRSLKCLKSFTLAVAKCWQIRYTNCRTHKLLSCVCYQLYLVQNRKIYVIILFVFYHSWQNSFSAAIVFLRRFCQIASGFHFFGFCNKIFFSEQGRQPCAQPPNLEDQVPVFRSPSDRVAQLYPQSSGSLFVAFYDSQGYGGGVPTRLHAGTSCFIPTIRM